LSTDPGANIPFAVWPQDGTEVNARAYTAVSAKQAAEKRAADDYKASGQECASVYCVRDGRTGTIWTVLVGVVREPSFVALDAEEVLLPAATHVLWGGRVLCKDLRLRGVPRDWPDGQRWISLKDVADGAALPDDGCVACWKKAPDLVTALKQIGADR